MPYFVVLVGMGQTAFGTNAVALLGLVYARYGYGALQTALLAFVAYAGLVLALLCLHQAGPLLRAARALCARLPPRLAGLRGYGPGAGAAGSHYSMQVLHTRLPTSEEELQGLPKAKVVEVVTSK